MKVSDVMSKQVDFVTIETPVKEVSLLIFGRGINGVPVCDGKKVVGFITEKDILSKFYPSMKEYVEDPVHSGNFEGMEGKVTEILGFTAEDIMNKNPITVQEDMPLLKAQSLMFISKIGRLPVVNKEKNLVGMLTKGDVFRAAVGDTLLFGENEDYNDWLSKTYYATVNWKDRLGHEMPDLLRVLRKNKVKEVLDVGCGTGEYSIELAKKGFIVAGVDRSRAMIEEANSKKKTLSKEVKERVSFQNINLESFLLNHNEAKFDCALFMGNTISHNPHKYIDIIKKTSESLSKNGMMVFQITNFEKNLKVDKRLLSFNFTKLYDEEYAFLEFYDLPNEKDKTILKTFSILKFDGKRWRSFGVRNSLMAYSTREILKTILKKFGFSSVSFYGSSFDGKKWDYLFRKPFKPLESDWLNIVAKK